MHRSSCKGQAIVVRFKWNLHCLDICWKNKQVLNFIKTHPVVAIWCFRTDRRWARHGDSNCRFSQFCEKRLKTVHIIRPLNLWIPYDFQIQRLFLYNVHGFVLLAEAHGFLCEVRYEYLHMM